MGVALGLRSIATNKIKGEMNVWADFSVLIFLLKFFIYPIDTRLGDMIQLHQILGGGMLWHKDFGRVTQSSCIKRPNQEKGKHK